MPALSAEPSAGYPDPIAERLSRLGLQPFNRTTVLRASRQIEVVVHHQQLMVHALAAPLRPLPRATRVLVAMCG